MKKKFVKTLVAGLAVSSMFIFAACDTASGDNSSTSAVSTTQIATETGSQTTTTQTAENDQIYQIYLLAKNSGFTGSYEEWLASIKGEAIELQVLNGVIQWKYKSANTWIKLASLTDLKGKDGAATEMRVSDGYIQWRNVGSDTWNNLLEIKAAVVSIASTEINADGDLIITYTNGDVVNVGHVQGESSEALLDFYPLDDGSYAVSAGKAMYLSEVEIPATYNEKAVTKIARGAFSYENSYIKNLTIPASIKEIDYSAFDEAEFNNIYYNGSVEDWFKVKFDNSYDNPAANCKNFYVLDDNGTIVHNNKKYKLLQDLFVSTINDFYNNVEVSSIENMRITPTEELYIEGTDLYMSNYSLESIYFNGTLEEWFDLPMSGDLNISNLYILDRNGDVDYYGDKYSRVTDMTLPEDFDKSISTYVSQKMDLNSLSFAIPELLTSDNDELLSTIKYLLYDGMADDLDTTLELDNLYVLAEDGDLTIGGKTYKKYEAEQPTPLYEGMTNQQVGWDPISLAEAKESYNVSGSLDIWYTYSSNYGITYNGSESTFTNPVDNITYMKGDTLPTWKQFANDLGITKINQSSQYGYKDAQSYRLFMQTKNNSGAFIDSSSNTIDMIYNTTSNLQKMGDYLLDLTRYINSGKMPALAKFLNDNPDLKREITVDGKISYIPYLDGYQDVERTYNMDLDQVYKLLDYDLPTEYGDLVAGVAAAEDSKGLKGEPTVEPFICKSGFNYPVDTEIQIVGDAGSAITVTVKQTENIIDQQNKLLSTTDGSCTGRALLDQFKTYLKAAYGDIIDTYYDGRLSGVFSSYNACYNADDLVALLRVFKANPNLLYRSSTQYDEVVPVFPRGQADNRVENILQFGATLYGVQGISSEKDRLFIGADGKLHDAGTTQASYDLLQKLNNLYSEGLIQENFWIGSSSTGGYDKYFAKTAEGSTFGLLEYDYCGTQANANDIVNGLGTKPENRGMSESGYDFSKIDVTGIQSILSPLTYVSTESFRVGQTLDDFEGKTLVRYYEENRSIKSVSWGVLSSSDNIESAIALMDYMYTKEGNITLNYGPSAYLTEKDGNITYIDSVWESIENTNSDFWTYCRTYIGNTACLGYRPHGLDYITTNNYGLHGIKNVDKAIAANVQFNSRYNGLNTWNTTVPVNGYPTLDLTISSDYKALEDFWNQKAKGSKIGETNGWVAIVAYGSDYDGSVDADGNTYSDVKASIKTKNQIYLHMMSRYLGLVPPEAEVLD